MYSLQIICCFVNIWQEKQVNYKSIIVISNHCYGYYVPSMHPWQTTGWGGCKIAAEKSRLRIAHKELTVKPLPNAKAQGEAQRAGLFAVRLWANIFLATGPPIMISATFRVMSSGHCHSVHPSHLMLGWSGMTVNSKFFIETPEFSTEMKLTQATIWSSVLRQDFVFSTYRFSTLLRSSHPR